MACFPHGFMPPWILRCITPKGGIKMNFDTPSTKLEATLIHVLLAYRETRIFKAKNVQFT